MIVVDDTQTRHEIMTCPESVTYCVHYEAGCKVPFKRKDEQNHYIHEAVNHAKLVQGSLSRMKHQVGTAVPVVAVLKHG